MKKNMYFFISFISFSCIFSNISIKKDLTSNFDQRINKQNQAVKPKYIILHYTANCSETSILKWFKNYLYPVSAHYVIGPNGTITMTVDPKNRAWHAGESFWKGCEEMNTYSIGIEIVNPGSTQQQTTPCKDATTIWSKNDCYLIPGSENCWYPFTKKQIDSLILLCKHLMQKYKIMPANIIGHSDIAPGRKTDPGPLFPWRLLAEQGIGLWPKNNLKNYRNSNQKEIIIDIKKAQKYLELIGYNSNINGTIDEQMKKNIISFQIHFRPNNIDGQLDFETFNILENLAT